MVAKYDLILVGSGFASAFFLHKYLELSKIPKKILILERGFRHDLNWKISNHDKMERYGVVSEINYNDTFINNNREKDWVYNPSFGGGSNCWWACTPRFMPNDFKLKTAYGVGRDWPLQYEDLEPYYVEAESLMSISGPNDHICKRSSSFPQPPHNFNEVDKILKKAYPDHYFAQPTARARKATKLRPQCCASGVCYLCPVNAKFTIENDFKELFERPNVEIILGAEVTRIVPEQNSVKSVVYFKGGKERVVEGEVIALGANAIFNAGILLRSGFTDPELGRNLSEQTSQLVRVKLNRIKNFTGSTSITANGYMLYDGEHRRKRGAVLMESSNIPTFRFEKDRETEVAVFKFLIEDIPSVDNFISLDPKTDKPQTNFGEFSSYAKNTLLALREDVNKILSPLPIEEIEFAATPGRSEAHILGTTVMGKNIENSVVDSDLVHHKYRNLLLLGGGAFPTISPSNPTLTICALSLRAAERHLS